MPRLFQEIEQDLQPDGALRDFYISSSARKEWNTVLHLHRLRAGRRGVSCVQSRTAGIVVSGQGRSAKSQIA